MTIYFQAPGQAVNWNKERHINVNIHIVLNRNVYTTNESYDDVQEYTNQISSLLREYNIRPVVLNHLLSEYEDVISQYYEEGKDPKFFVDEIVKELELDSGGFMSYKMGSSGYNRVIKYL